MNCRWRVSYCSGPWREAEESRLLHGDDNVDDSAAAAGGARGDGTEPKDRGGAGNPGDDKT